MSGENGVSYLGIDADLAMRAINPEGVMVLICVTARLLSLGCKSPSQFCLALSTLQRSMLE